METSAFGFFSTRKKLSAKPFVPFFFTIDLGLATSLSFTVVPNFEVPQEATRENRGRMGEISIDASGKHGVDL